MAICYKKHEISEVHHSYKHQVEQKHFAMPARTTHIQCGLFPLHSILGKGFGKIMAGVTCYISVWSEMLSVIKECTDFDQVTRKPVH